MEGNCVLFVIEKLYLIWELLIWESLFGLEI